MSEGATPKQPAAKAAAKKPAASEKKDDTGKPEDALAPLAKAILDAAKKEPEGDPNVARAFALGWHMAELFAPKKEAEEPAKDRLVRMGALTEAERRAMLVAQIKADVARLADPLKKAGLDAPDLVPLSTAAGVPGVHLALLTTLTAADFRLGKAYGLARALADTCRNATETTFAQLFEAERLGTLLGWLDELSTALPPHAAGSVSRSLAQWRDHGHEDKAPLKLLRRQGELWRAVLSGEKRGTEMLHPDDYLEAGEGLARKTSALVRAAVVKFPLLLTIVGALVILGVALIVADKDGSIVAGATSLVAAVGLTWKGLGSSVGKVLATVEVPLWGAQLDIQIAQAITLLTVTEWPMDLWDRRAVAEAIPRPDLDRT